MSGSNNTINIESAEDYFHKNRKYIRHYYKEKLDRERIRLKCVDIVSKLVPNGTEPEQIIERSEKLFNWISHE